MTVRPNDARSWEGEAPAEPLAEPRAEPIALQVAPCSSAGASPSRYGSQNCTESLR